MSPRWIEALSSGPASLEFRTYLQLALTCASDDYRTMKPEDVAAVVPDSVRTVPLLQYRLGVCGRDHGAVLRAVRTADEELVDADYQLSRYAAQTRPYPDLDEALRLLRSAAAAFPGSPAIATTAGNVYQMIERRHLVRRAGAVLASLESLRADGLSVGSSGCRPRARDDDQPRRVSALRSDRLAIEPA
jgi:hypothetical protein